MVDKYRCEYMDVGRYSKNMGWKKSPRPNINPEPMKTGRYGNILKKSRKASKGWFGLFKRDAYMVEIPGMEAFELWLDWGRLRAKIMEAAYVFRTEGEAKDFREWCLKKKNRDDPEPTTRLTGTIDGKGTFFIWEPEPASLRSTTLWKVSIY